jgi:hypothetical protein
MIEIPGDPCTGGSRTWRSRAAKNVDRCCASKRILGRPQLQHAFSVGRPAHTCNQGKHYLRLAATPRRAERSASAFSRRSSRVLLDSQLTRTAGAALRSQSGTSACFTRLFVILASSHFFLDSAPFNQLAKAAHCFLDRLAIPNIQLNHTSSFDRAGGIKNVRRVESIARRTPREPISLMVYAGCCLSRSEETAQRIQRQI